MIDFSNGKDNKWIDIAEHILQILLIVVIILGFLYLIARIWFQASP